MSVINDLLRKGVEEAQARLGMAVVDREQLRLLEENAETFRSFRDEASELAYHSLSYFTGKPQELTPEARKRLSQRSRIALMEDPLAGAEAELLSNFSFGRGITPPQADDPKVQEVIDEAWSDPVNTEKLTGFEAQRHRSNELITQANLFPTAYVRNGYVRVGFLDCDTVTHIICDEEDEELPLWYVTRKHKVVWDFNEDRVLTTAETTELPKTIYYPHWRNVEDAILAAGEEGVARPKSPPKEKLGDGLVYHVRINRVGRTQFGTPPWARTLRFFKALNDVTESHVVMAQAASTWIAKRVMRGTPEAISKSANAILAQTGELGAARFGERPTDQAYPRQTAPPSGSFWLENESNRLEAMNLNSGSAQVAQTAQVIRAPIAAASSFGQHYLGDASNANLATATSLELPTLMVVQAWQETSRGMLGWFTDVCLQEAVRAGRLGGYGTDQVSAQEMAPLIEEGFTEEEAQQRVWESLPAAQRYARSKPITELWIREAEDKKEMERRTGKALDYTLTMPYPGRRNLPDVVSTVTGVAMGFDPQGVNVPLRRHLLNFLATHGMQLEDPAAFVDEVMPDVDPTEQGQFGPAHLMPGIDPATGEPFVDQRSQDYVPPPEPAPAPGGGASKPDKDRTKGAKRKGSPPKREMGGGGGNAREELSLGELFGTEVLDPLLNGSNGHG